MALNLLALNLLQTSLLTACVEYHRAELENPSVRHYFCGSALWCNGELWCTLVIHVWRTGTLKW